MTLPHAPVVEWAAPVENKRLKGIGMVLALAGFLGLGAVADRTADQWSLGAMHNAPLVALAMLAGNAFAAGLILIAAGCGTVRPWRDPRRRRAIILQFVLANVLIPVFLLGGVFDDRSLGRDDSTQAWQIGLALLAYLSCLWAWRLWRRSRQHDAIGADEAMALDPRPPILYLRSFQDDGLSLAAQEGTVAKRWLMRLLSAPTPEEQMAHILASIGPLIAIGKPGEPLPELGAARLYVVHDQWQQKVTALMQRAALVVVRVGVSPGVLWEIEQALANLPRQRLVLAILGGGAVAPELVARLSPVLGQSFDAALPQPPPGGWRTWVGQSPNRRIGGLLYFDVDGSAHAVPVSLRLSPWSSLIDLLESHPFAAPLRRAWGEVFAQLGLAGKSWPASRSRAIAVICAVLLGFVGAHWFYLGNRRRGWTYIAILPLLAAPVFLSYIDAIRFIWADRADFETRFVPHPSS